MSKEKEVIKVEKTGLTMSDVAEIISKELSEFSQQRLEHAAAILNELFESAPFAIDKLVKSKIVVDQKIDFLGELLNHPTLVTGLSEDGKFTIGLIGVLNAVLNTKFSTKRLASVIDEKTGMVKGFCVAENPEWAFAVSASDEINRMAKIEAKKVKNREA